MLTSRARVLGGGTGQRVRESSTVHETTLSSLKLEKERALKAQGQVRSISMP